MSGQLNPPASGTLRTTLFEVAMEEAIEAEVDAAIEAACQADGEEPLVSFTMPDGMEFGDRHDLDFDDDCPICRDMRESYGPAQRFVYPDGSIVEIRRRLAPGRDASALPGRA